MKLFYALLIVAALPSARVEAGQVGPSWFESGAARTTFEEFSGQPYASYQSLTFDQNVYSVVGNTGGVAVGTYPFQFTFSGNAIFFNSRPDGFGSIALGSAASAVGAWVSASFGSWSVRGEFFDYSSNLIGTATAVGTGFQPSFLGYSSDGASISHVRLYDLSADRNGIVMDNFMTLGVSAVPEIGIWISMIVGFAMIGCAMRSSAHGRTKNLIAGT